MNLHPSHPAITAAHVVAECARELEQRRRFYPRRIEQARMSEGEAAAQLALCEAWLEDARRIEASDYTPALPAPAQHGLSWTARRQGLQRELGFRARIYPARIAECRMTQAEAAHRTACLEALLARYDDGFDWLASNGRRPQFGLVTVGPDIEQARREWDEHTAALAAAATPPQQQELI
jgi:hypothetical protein